MIAVAYKVLRQLCGTLEEAITTRSASTWNLASVCNMTLAAM